MKTAPPQAYMEQAADAARQGRRLWVRGVVQGVGFRPFVYNLAGELGLAGWVRNTAAGVEIEVSGDSCALEAFTHRLRENPPPLARIDDLRMETCPAAGPDGFHILASSDDRSEFQPVPPDVATCPDCLRELFDPGDRRYRYPFINCTNCGPRLTIIESMPYDRPATTMAFFEMCDACRSEYQNPADRRFHAQPVACPTCGPRLWLEVDGARRLEAEEALQEARRRLAAGEIVAVKGLGGFHLACDAANPDAVERLRRRKGRGDKAFAVMFADVAAIEAEAEMPEAAHRALQRIDRPIVVLPRRSDSRLAPSLAPGQRTVGAMLPYTPLHHLLLERADGVPTALVMTSGNHSQEPIVADDDEARSALGAIADAFLLHDRRIRQRCDDSVQRIFRGEDYPLRRSRGQTPTPLAVPAIDLPILALGAEQKNTFCLVRDGQAFLGPHLGDLENESSLRAFEETVAHFESLFRVTPELLAVDAHPDYLATRYGERRAERDGIGLVRVQHHHAHIASLLAERRAAPDRPVIGLAFDGSGYGDDGTIWGGEILLADMRSARRLGYLTPLPMPGGEAAIRSPWRMGLAWLRHAGVAWTPDLPCVSHATDEQLAVIERLLAPDAPAAGLNAPLTSSLGRLFDAAAAIAGIRLDVREEGQAAIELEALADPAEEGAYAFSLRGMVFDAAPLIAELVADVRRRVPVSRIAARFHNGVAAMVRQVARRARDLTGVHQVGLSGGVWQNQFLLERSVTLLEADEFEVWLHRSVPANDGGLALGQAVVAAWRAG